MTFTIDINAERERRDQVVNIYLLEVAESRDAPWLHIYSTVIGAFINRNCQLFSADIIITRV